MNQLSEARRNKRAKAPPPPPSPSLKQLYRLLGIWSHPQWVTMAMHFLKSAIVKSPLTVDKMQMTHHWNDDSHKPLLFSLMEGPHKDETI